MVKKTDIRKPAGSSVRKNAPLLIIAGTILLIIVGFLILPTAFQTRTSSNPPSGTSTEVSMLRQDGNLFFTSPQGAQRAMIAIEIARTDEARTKGLMGRTSMREDQGMLFLFPNAEERSFWMANTPLSLDIIFVGSNKRVLNIHHSTVPYSEASHTSRGSAQFVVEVNGGFSRRHGIEEGDLISWMAQ